MFDTLILGGQLIDGTGGPSVKSDLGIKADRIQATGNLAAASAARIIDATGLTLCPGFIDTHCHSDGVLLLDGQHAMGIRQGVTTEVLGNCGFSVAPILPDKVDVLREYLSGSAPWLTFEPKNFSDYCSNFHSRNQKMWKPTTPWWYTLSLFT